MRRFDVGASAHACSTSESGIGRVGGRYPMDILTELQTVLINS